MILCGDTTVRKRDRERELGDTPPPQADTRWMAEKGGAGLIIIST